MMNKKIFFIAGSLLAFSLGFIQVSVALEVPVIDKLRQKISTVEDNFESTKKEFLQGFRVLTNPNFDSEVNQITQDLGVADLFGLEQKIEERLAKISKESSDFEKWISSKIAVTHLRQKSSKAQASTILGQKAQIRSKQQQELSLAAVEKVHNHTQKAQQKSVTQKIMKEMIGQNQEIATMTYLNLEMNQKQNELMAAANVNLADISQHFSQEERENQLTRKAAYDSILRDNIALNALWTNNSGRCSNWNC